MSYIKDARRAKMATTTSVFGVIVLAGAVSNGMAFKKVHRQPLNGCLLRQTTNQSKPLMQAIFSFPKNTKSLENRPKR
jgi:hypothetical protein